jgi:DNA-binding winged helix-turn-helix (wHTH) protein/tetratricopeptide (TPR) repeat protein
MANSPKHKVYEFGEFRLDAEHLMLSRGSSEIALAPKAVETLLALVERRGEIVSKDELLDAVWPDAVVEESNLFLYLSVLRKTLGDQPGGGPWVETLRRRGYRFTGDVKILQPQSNGKGSAVSEMPRSVHLAPVVTAADNETSAQDLPGPQYSRSARSSRSLAAVAVVAIVVLIAVGALGYRYFVYRPAIRSIAVMPAQNDSGNQELEYLSDSMVHQMIGSLKKIPGLEVKSSSIVQRLKAQGLDAAAIGKELNVQAVLYPRIVLRGSDVTLYLELVDPHSQNVIWQRQYFRTMAQLGELQRNAVADVSGGLRLSLSDTTKQRIARDYTENAEATRLYFLGTYLIRKLDEAKVREGIGFLRQATEQDPTYAPAYAMIATGLHSLTLCCDVHPSEMAEARAAATRAIELDDYLAEAHSALASSLFLYDWNFAEAERHYQRALELDPNSAAAHFQYADFLMRSGKPDEGKEERRLALGLDPYSPFFNAFAANDGDPDRAMERARFAIDLDPNFYFSHMIAAGVYARKKMYSEAIAEYRRAKELAPGQTWSDVNFSRMLTSIGDVDGSRTILNELLERSRSRYVSPFHIAAIYHQLGDTENAILWLEKAYQVRDPKMVFLKTAPRMQKLKDDPRFLDIYRRVFGEDYKAGPAIGE